MNYTSPRSTIPYPVPFYLIPSAVYQLYQYIKNAHNPYVINHAKYIYEKIGTEYSDWGRVAIWPPEGLKVILPSNSAVDFPFSHVPDHLVSCGPIVLPAKPLKEADPGLAVWVAKRPTVYINLGTHATYEEADARELAGALKMLLDAAKKNGQELQVLWKLKKRGDYKGEGFSAVLEAIGSEWEENVRITDWLEAEPMSILESGSVICSVNHGGANSYFEAVRYEDPPSIDSTTRTEAWQLTLQQCWYSASRPSCMVRHLRLCDASRVPGHWKARQHEPCPQVCCQGTWSHLEAGCPGQERPGFQEEGT